MKKEIDQGFIDQLPETGHIPIKELYPRLDELKKYSEWFFDPQYDGYERELEYIGGLPFHSSREVQSSPLGVGFEVLDHRAAYTFSKVLPYARNTGVKWARLQSGWQRAEKEPGKYDFSWLDEIVDGLLDAGIQPWFSLSFGNGLYMDAEPTSPTGTYVFSPTHFGEKCVQAWIRYCQAMAVHFKTRVFHWEVWNEPNAGFLRKPNMGSIIEPEPPEVYAKLVAVTEKAIHSVQPEGKIIAGAISGGNIYHSKYIHGLFRCGIAGHIDIFSYHPYNSMPELYFPQMAEFIRRLIAESGRPITLWQGENGRPSNTIMTKRGWKATEGSQARYLTRRYLTDLRLKIEMSSYFLICDLGNGYAGKDKVHSQGIIDGTDPENYRPKLAYRAMQSMAWLFDSRTQPAQNGLEIHPMPDWNQTTLPLESAFSITSAFRRGDIPIFAYYHPSHLDADWQVKPVAALFWLENNFIFRKPVLIDPITAKIYRIVKMAEQSSEQDGVYIEIPRLPLLDYPLFITDAILLKE